MHGDYLVMHGDHVKGQHACKQDVNRKPGGTTT